MQINFDWRPDLSSLILGMLIGLGLAVAIARSSPWLRRRYRQVRGWIEGRISWMRSGVETRFRAETAVYAQTAHLGQAWAELDQIFVPPRLLDPMAERKMMAENRDMVEMARLWPEMSGRMGVLPRPSVSVAQLLLNGRRVIISGEAGSGKSALLAYLAHYLASTASEDPDEAEADVIPVLVHLAEMSWPDPSEDPETEPDPLAPLAESLQKRSHPLTAPGIGDMLKRQLEAGQLFLLLDGWGECGPETRPLVIDWLRQLLTLYSKTPIFMTAALDGYGDLLRFGFTRTEIMPWRLGQVQTFHEKWTAVLALENPPPLEMIWRPGQTALETSLRFWLAAFLATTEEKTDAAEESDEKESPPVMPAWPEQPPDWPALLTAVLPLFLPRKKEEPFPLPDESNLAFWQELVGTAVSDGQTAVARQAVIDLATALAQDEEGEVDKQKAGRWRKSIAQCGLFVRWANGGFGWQNTRWRDYLTAGFVTNQHREDLILTHLQDPGWRGILSQLAGLTDLSPAAEELLQNAAEDPAQEGLFTAAAWIRAGTPGKWQRQVMIALGQMVRQPTHPFAWRCRAAAVMAATGERGVLTFMKKLLQKADPMLRCAATAVLPLLAAEEVPGLLAERLTDPELLVRKTAVAGLIHLQQNPLTERPLVMALIGEDEELSLFTAEALALNGGPGIEILREAVADEDIQVRRAAVHGLALVEAEWVEPLLQEMERQDEEWFVRSAANAALETIRHRQEPELWRPVRASNQPWLEGIALATGKKVPSGRAAAAYVTTIFKEATDPGTRVSSARLLGQLPAPEAIPLLVEAAAEEDEPLLRVAALVALGHLRRAYGAPA